MPRSESLQVPAHGSGTCRETVRCGPETEHPAPGKSGESAASVHVSLPPVWAAAPMDALLPGAVGLWGNEAMAEAGGCGREKPELTPFVAHVGLSDGSRDSESSGRSSGVPREASQRSWE